MTGPKIDHVVVKLTFEWFTMLIQFSGVFFKGHKFCLSAVCRPLMFAWELLGYFHYFVVPRGETDSCFWKILGYYFPPFFMNPCPVFDIGCDTGLGLLVAHIADAKIHIYQGSRHSKRLGGKTLIHKNADRFTHNQRFRKQRKNHLAAVDLSGRYHPQAVYVFLKPFDLRANLAGGWRSTFSGHSESNHAMPDSHAATSSPII